MDADQPEPGRDAPAGTGLPRRRLLRAGRAAGIGGLAGMLGLAVGNATSVAEDGRHVAVGGTGAPGTVHVSDQGDDRNDGLSWASPLRSVASGLARLRGGPGTVEVGPGQFEETALTMDVHQSIRGRGPHSTVVQLAESGTLFDLSDVQYCRLEDIGLQFTNSSVSGTLMDMANTFTCTFRNVRFSGTNAPDQVGVHLRDNAGDSTFLQSFIAELDVGVQVDTAVNYFIGCTFSANRVGVRGGDPSGQDRVAGIVVTDSTFRGDGEHYVHVTGRAQSWILKGCWFDGHADTAVEIGDGEHGPWVLSLSDIPAVAGRERSVVLNAADSVSLHGVMFIDTGSRPTELLVDPGGCPRGSVGATWSAQGTAFEELVPPGWAGAAPGGLD